MAYSDKYLEVLKKFDDFVTIREWAEKFAEINYEDFERIDKNARSHKTTKNKTNGLRELTKRIRDNLKFNEAWSGLIAAYDNSLPIKVKYVGNLVEENMSELMDNLYYQSNNKKDSVSASFETIMDELDYFDFDYLNSDGNLPKRDDSKYINDIEATGIEYIDAFEYSSCMMLEMAHRNDEVIDTINKIEYIQELMRKPIIELRTEMYDSFKNSLIESRKNSDENIQRKTSDLLTQLKKNIEDAKLLLGYDKSEEAAINDLLNSSAIKPDDENSIKVMTLDYFSSKSYTLQYEYKYIINLQMDSFKKELEFCEYSSKVTEFFKKKNILDPNIQYLYKLSAIMELLQKRLDSNFFIYPHKYYKGMVEPCSYNVKCKNFIRSGLGIQKAMKSLNDSAIEESLQKYKEFKQFKTKQYTMKDITDMFFMYDYYKARLDKVKPEITLNSIAKELKYALTIFYGITDNTTKKIISYDDCLEKYHEFTGQVSYYSTERHITDKINLMKYFIDQKHFRCLIFS